jgi:G:T/U-mismatch repair DNA glycosylase
MVDRIRVTAFMERLDGGENSICRIGYSQEGPPASEARRATASADVLSAEELIAGARRLRRKVRRYRPALVAFLGVSAYRTAFRRPWARTGRQEERIAGAGVWVLPNPSGLNAHYKRSDLAHLFAEMRRAIESVEGAAT